MDLYSTPSEDLDAETEGARLPSDFDPEPRPRRPVSALGDWFYPRAAAYAPSGPDLAGQDPRDDWSHHLPDTGKTMAQHGAKLDEGKPRWTLLPWDALSEIVLILHGGAMTHGPDSWSTIPNAERRYLDALMRHLAPVLRGEGGLSEHGYSHLAHAATNALFLLALELRRKAT